MSTNQVNLRRLKKKAGQCDCLYIQPFASKTKEANKSKAKLESDKHNKEMKQTNDIHKWGNEDKHKPSSCSKHSDG